MPQNEYGKRFTANTNYRNAQPFVGGVAAEDWREELPPLYSSENTVDPLVVVKFFTAAGGWTWYVIEGSPVDENGYYNTDKPKTDYVFFGLVDGLEVELGYFARSELAAWRDALGLPLERDVWWEPKPLSAVRAEVAR